jgi:hypothetical protein
MTAKRFADTALLLGALFTTGACTDEDASREALRKSGYKQVEITGYRPFQCGRDDAFSTGFRATSPGGERVEGTVCCGRWLKGCTVRF